MSLSCQKFDFSFSTYEQYKRIYNTCKKIAPSSSEGDNEVIIDFNFSRIQVMPPP